MTGYYERAAVVDRWTRHAKRAVAYLGNARYGLTVNVGGQPLIRYAPTTFWTLLDETLETALDIVEALPDDFFIDGDVDDVFGLGAVGRYNTSDEPYEAAAKVVAAFDRRRKNGKRLRRATLLENVDGRTPEEAAAFRRKAEELRS